MICWECKKEISEAISYRYLEFHEGAELSKETNRTICNECSFYLEPTTDVFHNVRVKRISGKKLKFTGDGWHNRFAFRVLTPDGKRQKTI